MLRPAQRVCSGNGDAYQGFQERLSMCALHGRTTPGTHAPCRWVLLLDKCRWW